MNPAPPLNIVENGIWYQRKSWKKWKLIKVIFLTTLFIYTFRFEGIYYIFIALFADKLARVLDGDSDLKSWATSFYIIFACLSYLLVRYFDQHWPK